MDITLLVFISMVMFCIGVMGILFKRNILIIFLSIELMLNAANLLFVVFARHWGNSIGHIWVFFVLVVAAAEAAVGMAIIINLFRSKKFVDIDRFNELKEPGALD
jgi:NADH-quinone oxidoreductase subunit K